MADPVQKRILAVDDTESSRYTLVRYLERAGYEVWQAETGEEALRMAEHRPDLIVLDIKLPDILGYDVCRLLKKNPHTAAIPVLHTSATFKTSGDKVKALECGADGYLTEPIEPEELIANVRVLLNLRETQEALARNRERLELAQEAAQIGTFDWNLQTGEVTWSPSEEHLYGLGRGDFAGKYEAWASLLHPDDRETAEAEVRQAIEKCAPLETAFRIVRPDGAVRWIQAKGKVLRNGGGVAGRFIGVNIDITERQQAEQALRETRDQLAHAKDRLENIVQERTAALQEAVRELEGFTYSITHDMRAPLRAMGGFAELLLADYGSRLDTQGVDYVRRIMKSAQRLDLLITDVLNYSKLVRGELPLAAVNLDTLVRDMTREYPEFQMANAEMRIDGTLPMVLGNEALLTQCLSNLLSNAVKFVPAGRQPQVEICAELQAAFVRLWIKDNGIGIDPRHRARIFQMFERLHAPHEYAGTGIGLTIVRKAVERMGGQVGFESEPGEGSRFWVDLRPAS